ncbi:S24/S26 family peptidase [Senegalimassilia anaerobia]
MRTDAVFLLKAKLAVRGETQVSLRGGSMRPLLTDGDSARVVSVSSCEVGRIYVFADRNGGGLIAHRAVKVEDGEVHLKGDHTGSFEVVASSDLVGEVVSFRASNADCWHSVAVNSLEAKATALLSRMMGDSFSGDEQRFRRGIYRRLLGAALDATNELKRKYLLSH